MNSNPVVLFVPPKSGLTGQGRGTKMPGGCLAETARYCNDFCLLTGHPVTLKGVAIAM
jgi:hypothetical protein